MKGGDFTFWDACNGRLTVAQTASQFRLLRLYTIAAHCRQKFYKENTNREKVFIGGFSC